MTAVLDESFAHTWGAEVLERPPLIAPAAQFVYPWSVAGEEDALARGALQVLVRPQGRVPFLASFALGFSDARMPTGIWSCPNARELCAVAGGYAYVLDSEEPRRCELLELRPVVEVLPRVEAGLLVFIGINELAAWGADGLAWRTARLSWEGLRIESVEGGKLCGFGWELRADRELPFSIDLKTGAHTGGAYWREEPPRSG